MELTIREKIGQRLVMGIRGTEVDTIFEEMVRDYKISNVILFRHNIIDEEQTTRLCSDIQEMVYKHTGHGAFITIDQEGGMVTRLNEEAVNVPGAMAISATGKVENAYEAGIMTGKQLRKLGINFNLAPVFDINSNSENPVIGVRSYGDTKEVVTDYGVAMMKGLRDAGVLASAKHFPGHGDTNVDSHLGLPVIPKTMDELMDFELVPFKKAMDEGIPSVMTTHILFPKIEKENVPGTMSRTIITGLLKEKLNYNGLVISDGMEMDAISKYYGTVEGTVKAMEAGVDLVFICHTQSLVKEAVIALEEALNNGRLSISEMNTSVRKILDLKSVYTSRKTNDVLFDLEEALEKSYEMLKKSISPVVMLKESLPEVNEDTVFVGMPPFRATNVSNAEIAEFSFDDYMSEAFNAKAVRMTYEPDEEEAKRIVDQSRGAKTAFIGTYNGHIYKGQLNVVKELAKVCDEVVVLAFRNPYDLEELPGNVYGIAVYEYSRNSLRAVKELLNGEYEMTGQLPVKLGGRV